MSNHENLQAWQVAIELVDLVYDLCKQLPADERFGLVQQLQRAAVSVPANLAEGCGRDSTRDFLRHISIARGSLAEVSTFLEIIRRRQFAVESDIADVEEKAAMIGNLTGGLRRALQKKLGLD